MAAYLLRRIAYGCVTVLGVLLLLFVLFFTVTDPDDIARKAVGERARPEAVEQGELLHRQLAREEGAFPGELPQPGFGAGRDPARLDPRRRLVGHRLPATEEAHRHALRSPPRRDVSLLRCPAG